MNGPGPRILTSVGDILIGVQPDPLVVPGQQWIYITHKPSGTALADFLTDTWLLSDDQQWHVLPHTSDVDHRLKKLIDLAAALRMAAPALVQLTFLPDDHGHG